MSIIILSHKPLIFESVHPVSGQYIDPIVSLSHETPRLQYTVTPLEYKNYSSSNLSYIPSASLSTDPSVRPGAFPFWRHSLVPSLGPSLIQSTDSHRATINKQSSVISAVPSVEHYDHPILIPSYAAIRNPCTYPCILPSIFPSQKSSSVSQIVPSGCSSTDQCPFFVLLSSYTLHNVRRCATLHGNTFFIRY